MAHEFVQVSIEVPMHSRTVKCLVVVSRQDTFRALEEKLASKFLDQYGCQILEGHPFQLALEGARLFGDDVIGHVIQQPTTLQVVHIDFITPPVDLPDLTDGTAKWIVDLPNVCYSPDSKSVWTTQHHPSVFISNLPLPVGSGHYMIDLLLETMEPELAFDLGDWGFGVADISHKLPSLGAGSHSFGWFPRQRSPNWQSEQSTDHENAPLHKASRFRVQMHLYRQKSDWKLFDCLVTHVAELDSIDSNGYMDTSFGDWHNFMQTFQPSTLHFVIQCGTPFVRVTIQDSHPLRFASQLHDHWN